MRWAMLRKSIVGRLGEEAQQAESNSIKLAEVVTAMRKAHLKEACADGFALRRTKRGAEAEAAEAAEAAGKLRRCKEDGAAAAEVRHTGSPSHRAPLRLERSWATVCAGTRGGAGGSDAGDAHRLQRSAAVVGAMRGGSASGPTRGVRARRQRRRGGGGCGGGGGQGADGAL